MRNIGDEVVLVTGATSGIGLAAAQQTGSLGAQILVHGRSEQTADRAAATLRASGVAVAGTVAADLQERAAVEQLVEQAEDLGVTVLVNNAGVYRRTREETPEGRELTWTVNHLHPSLLTLLLLDHLLDNSGRVVNVSAVVHGRARLDLSDPEYRTRQYNHFHAYANSKLANLLMVRELAKQVGPDASVVFTAVHPGVVSTKLLTEGMRVEGHDEPSAAGAAVAALAVDPAFGSASGQYFSGTQPTAPTGPGADDALAAALYQYTLTELGFQ